MSKAENTFTDATSHDAEPDRELELRRNKTKAARATADEAKTRVDELDTEIDANAARTRDYEKALEKARSEVAWLEKALKTTAKQRESLRASRTKAGKASAKARNKAQKVEVKYDQTVLSEIVRREKLADLSQDDSSSKVPERETTDLGTATSIEVAARTTAEHA
jgi:chromosome segregation ATPase